MSDDPTRSNDEWIAGLETMISQLSNSIARLSEEGRQIGREGDIGTFALAVRAVAGDVVKQGTLTIKYVDALFEKLRKQG